MRQEPITREDVKWALWLRDSMITPDVDAEDARLILGARVILWTGYTLAAATREFPDPLSGEMLGQNDIENSLHFFLCEHAEEEKIALGVLRGSGNSRFIVMFKRGGRVWCEFYERNHVPKERCQEDLLIILGLTKFMRSKYAHIQQVRPNKTPGRIGKKRPEPAIAAIIARKPEIVNAIEVQLREKGHGTGGWTLQHETPVEGHWRNQWYPSLDKHKRIFIAPFVKGVGKPKRQAVRVIKVVR